MKYVQVAPVGVLLLALTAPSIGQTTEDTRKEAFAPKMQTPAQVSTATAQPGERQLTDEEMGDLFMARKQNREASENNKRLSDSKPKNALYLNKLGIGPH